VEEAGLQVPVTVPLVTVRLAGQLAVRPVAGETTVVRVTVPVKPPEGVIVIVELPVAPVLKFAGLVAEIAKSGPATAAVTTAATLTNLDAVPTVPATFTVYVFGAVHLIGATVVHVTVTFRVTVLDPPAATPSISVGTPGLGVVAFAKSIARGWRVEGVTVEERVTLMWDAARLLIVRVEVANEVVLLVKLRETGLAEIENGTTLAETLVETESPPPTPVTLIEYALTVVAVVDETVRVAVTVPPDGTVTMTLVPVEVPLLKVTVGGLAAVGDIVKERVTFAVNVLTLVSVRILELDEPIGFTREVGLAAMVKLGTVTVMFRSVWWNRNIAELPVPVALRIRS
jgi:hypothetical protein